MSRKNINILTVISSLIFGIMIALIVVQYSKYEYLGDLSNGLYKEDSIYFKVDDADKIEKVMENIESGDIIFGEITNDYRAVYFKKRYSIPMKSGRFFKKDDFDENKNYVVIGSEHKSQIQNIDGKDIFEYGGVKFEVIGIVGMDIASPLDKMIFFSLKNVQQYLSVENTMYVISTNNKKCTALEETDAEIYDVPSVGVHRVINYKVTIFIIAYCCVALTLFCIVSLLHMFLDNQKNKIRVYGIMGFRHLYIVDKLFMEQAMYIITPVVIGVIIFYILFGKWYIGIQQIMLIMLMVMLLMLFLLFILVRKIRMILKNGELFYD